MVGLSPIFAAYALMEIPVELFPIVVVAFISTCFTFLFSLPFIWRLLMPVIIGSLGRLLGLLVAGGPLPGAAAPGAGLGRRPGSGQARPLLGVL